MTQCFLLLKRNNTAAKVLCKLCCTTVLLSQQKVLGIRKYWGDTGNRVVYHHMNSPGALNVKEGVKTRKHDSRRENCMSREPPGYYFGKRVLLPECSSRWPWSDEYSTLTSPRGCISKGVLDFLPEEKTMCCTNLLLERAA